MQLFLLLQVQLAGAQDQDDEGESITSLYQVSFPSPDIFLSWELVFSVGFLELYSHRRRIKTEEKAKVVASVCGTELIQFLATLAVLHEFE